MLRSVYPDIILPLLLPTETPFHALWLLEVITGIAFHNFRIIPRREATIRRKSLTFSAKSLPPRPFFVPSPTRVNCDLPDIFFPSFRNKEPHRARIIVHATSIRYALFESSSNILRRFSSRGENSNLFACWIIVAFCFLLPPPPLPVFPYPSLLLWSDKEIDNYAGRKGGPKFK